MRPPPHGRGQRHGRCGWASTPSRSWSSWPGRIAEELGADLERRFLEIEWQVELGEGQPKDPQAPIAELVRDARQLLDHGWDLVICLTDIPCAPTAGR